MTAGRTTVDSSPLGSRLAAKQRASVSQRAAVIFLDNKGTTIRNSIGRQNLTPEIELIFRLVFLTK